MTLNFRPLKSQLVAAVAGASLAFATPASASQADIELLKSYIGDWKGRGTTTSGGNTETVVCRLDITNSSTMKVNYNGRCTLAGGNLSIAGTMAFVTERQRFEAVMSSNTSFSGIAIGKRRGKAIDFELRDRDPETGKDYAIDAGIELKDGNISVEFSVVEVASGNKVVAVIPFKK